MTEPKATPVAKEVLPDTNTGQVIDQEGDYYLLQMSAPDEGILKFAWAAPLEPIHLGDEMYYRRVGKAFGVNDAPDQDFYVEAELIPVNDPKVAAVVAKIAAVEVILPEGVEEEDVDFYIAMPKKLLDYFQSPWAVEPSGLGFLKIDVADHNISADPNTDIRENAVHENVIVGVQVIR